MPPFVKTPWDEPGISSPLLKSHGGNYPAAGSPRKANYVAAKNAKAPPPEKKGGACGCHSTDQMKSLSKFSINSCRPE